MMNKLWDAIAVVNDIICYLKEKIKLRIPADRVFILILAKEEALRGGRHLSQIVCRLLVDNNKLNHHSALCIG